MKTYAIVGTSYRGFRMFASNIVKHFSDCAKIVGLCDKNPKRAAVYNSELGTDFPIFTDFEEMINTVKPDVVIVTTIDRYHHEYVIKAMEMGCDVISEKPLTIDADKYNAIAEAKKRTGRKLTVTFNLRFAPFPYRVKELLSQGAIGDIYSANLEWILDTVHGADYFRRWHRYKENSGGLLLHKSTHHFDLMNWFLGQDPVAVNAFGTTRFYGKNFKGEHGERCLTCPCKGKCPYYFDIDEDPFVKKLYHDVEDVDGYYRDRCIFAEDITAEDTVALSVEYAGGTVMNYSLNAHSPYEGYRMIFNGSEGRMVVENFYHMLDINTVDEMSKKITVYNRLGEEIVYNYPINANLGDHGGGDIRLLEMIIRGGVEDPLGQQAGLHEGAMSIMIGIAANASMKENRQVTIKELIKE